MSAAAGLWPWLGPARGEAGLVKPLIGGLGASSKPRRSASHTPAPLGNKDIPRHAFWGRGQRGLVVLLLGIWTSQLCSLPLPKVSSTQVGPGGQPSLCLSVTVELALCGVVHPGFLEGRWGVFVLFFTYECLDPAFNQLNKNLGEWDLGLCMFLNSSGAGLVPVGSRPVL